VSFRRWWRERSRNRRRKRAAKENQSKPLREFVYLDEVSVFSLLASRIGALATDFTETESSSLTSEIKGTAGVSAPVGKATVSSGIKADQATGTQVMRKSTVQSTFGEFYDYVREGFVLAPPAAGTKLPSLKDAEALIREADGGGPWVLDANSLDRGQLLEVEVELEADESFRASVVFSTLLEFIEELPQLPDTVDREGLLNAITGTRILDKLLAGLVPARGKALDYMHVTVGEKELIVHRDVLEAQEDLTAEIRTLYVVGVAEEDLFWRDIRRVLFSGARYRMLCRLARKGAQPQWTPVKLTEVLEGVVPGLRDFVEEIPSLLATISEQEDSEAGPEDMMRHALERYAEELLAIHEQAMSRDDLKARGMPTREQSAGFATLEARRAAFDSLTEDLITEFDIDAKPEVLAACRGTALIEAGLLAPVSAIPEDTATQNLRSAPAVRYLDCEIIAVYW
jgi:hypothetical protein